MSRKEKPTKDLGREHQGEALRPAKSNQTLHKISRYRSIDCKSRTINTRSRFKGLEIGELHDQHTPSTNEELQTTPLIQAFT